MKCVKKKKDYYGRWSLGYMLVHIDFAAIVILLFVHLFEEIIHEL